MSDTAPATIAGVRQNEIPPVKSKVEYRGERKRLTKAEIVKGTGYTRDHYVKQWDGYVTIRPLSEAEWQDIRQLTMRGIRQTSVIDPETGRESGDMQVDYTEQMHGAVEADRLTVAYGLSVGDEDWNVDEVANLRPASVVEQIAQEVLKLSGIRIPRQRRRAHDADDDAEREQEALEAEVDTFPEDS